MAFRMSAVALCCVRTWSRSERLAFSFGSSSATIFLSCDRFVPGSSRNRSRLPSRQLLPSARHFRSCARGGHFPSRSACLKRATMRHAPHSITSSAPVSSEGGTERPSALAAFRLMTNSNLVGCWTGKSCGLAPFRMRSIYPAASRDNCARSSP